MFQFNLLLTPNPKLVKKEKELQVSGADAGNAHWGLEPPPKILISH
jgi:hypothetical protein